MGRISKRKAAKKTTESNVSGIGKKSEKKYKAGIYARLSAKIDTDKSESIDTQIRIAKNFADEFNRKNNESIEIVGCYTDV